MKALIFGAGGQDGHYVEAECRRRGIDVVSTSKRGDARCRALDVSDYAAATATVIETQPDIVFQFAARSTTAHDAVMENHAAIATGTVSVLEAVKRFAPQAKVLVVGSAVQFKNDGLPIDEDCPFEASSAYAAARIYAVEAARYYASIGIRAYVAYLFHHDSPLRKPPHMAAVIANAAKEGTALRIEAPDFEKEWTHAEDTVRGMFALLDQDKVREVVVGSGETHSMREWAEECFSAVGLDYLDYVTEGDAPAETRVVSKTYRLWDLGWKPKVNFTDLAKAMVSK